MSNVPTSYAQQEKLLCGSFMFWSFTVACLGVICLAAYQDWTCTFTDFDPCARRSQMIHGNSLFGVPHLSGAHKPGIS